MAKSPFLSAMVLTHNETDKLDRMLSSISPYVDEIVVIDDMSDNPKTIEISKKYSAKVIHHPLEGNFGRQRNLAIENATGEWVIKADPDELFPQATMRAIRKACENAPEEVAAFSLRLVNVLWEKELNCIGQEAHMAVFRRSRVRFLGNVHPKIEINGIVSKLDAQILHYPLETVSQFVSKVNFYTNLEIKKIADGFDGAKIPNTPKQLITRLWKIFFKMNFKKKGYKDGWRGFVWIFLNNLLPEALRALKYWEFKEINPTNGK